MTSISGILLPRLSLASHRSEALLSTDKRHNPQSNNGNTEFIACPKVSKRDAPGWRWLTTRANTLLGCIVQIKVELRYNRAGSTPSRHISELALQDPVYEV